jgi:hypothetical protein
MAKVTIDGKEYEVEALSENARQQLVSIGALDEEIRRTQMRLAFYQTARKAYAAALNAVLPKSS